MEPFPAAPMSPYGAAPTDPYARGQVTVPYGTPPPEPYSSGQARLAQPAWEASVPYGAPPPEPYSVGQAQANAPYGAPPPDPYVGNARRAQPAWEADVPYGSLPPPPPDPYGSQQASVSYDAPPPDPYGGQPAWDANVPYGAPPPEYGPGQGEPMDSSYGPSPMEQYTRSGEWQDYGPDGAWQSNSPDGSPASYGPDPNSYLPPGNVPYPNLEKSPAGAVNGIDPETGIAPRRLTDCVCTVLFGIYVLGMIILVMVVQFKTVNGHSYSDLRRLSRGMDYKARLCGADAGVEDKPFIFWCRSNPVEWWAPSALDLWNPSCVKECPHVNGSHAPVPCLYPQQKYFCSSEAGEKCKIPGPDGPHPDQAAGDGQLGEDKIDFRVQSQQSIVMTNPYNTKAVGGRYCMPVNITLRQTILRGPMNGPRRAVGSFRDCWGVLFLTTVLTVCFSYVYVLMMNECGKFLVYGFLTSAFVMFGVSGIFLLATLGPYPEARHLNPLFNTQTELTAMIITGILGLFLVSLSCAMSGTITHVASQWGHIRELIRASGECILAMRSMLIPPAVEAIWKFFLAWILTHNFLYLMSVGWVDDHRISIDGQEFKGLNARFYFDWAILPWMGLYLYGAVWIMELCNAFGQFLVAFSVISWYFMKKEGSVKTGVPPLPPLHGTLDGVFYHFGSLCLGAAIVPWVRPIRIFNWILDESFPSADAECCGPLSFLTPVCQTVGKTFGACADGFRKHFTPACCTKKGCAYKYTKNVYSDVIIRSQHFLPAADRSSIIINTHKSCQRYMMSLSVITAIGVISIGSICAVLTYFMVLTTPSLSDPTSDYFVASPLAVALFSCFLSGDIAYGFMALLDHTADTLLYCYAWNKKFNKETVDEFMPESIRDLVGHIYEQEDGYQYFGNAKPEMYLASWMPKTYREKQQQSMTKSYKNPQQSAQTSQQGSQQRQLQADAAYSGAPEETSGQYMSMGGYSQPEQSDAWQGGGYYFGSPMYSGGGYDNSGRYMGPS